MALCCMVAWWLPAGHSVTGMFCNIKIVIFSRKTIWRTILAQVHRKWHCYIDTWWYNISLSIMLYSTRCTISSPCACGAKLIMKFHCTLCHLCPWWVGYGGEWHNHFLLVGILVTGPRQDRCFEKKKGLLWVMARSILNQWKPGWSGWVYCRIRRLNPHVCTGNRKKMF